MSQKADRLYPRPMPGYDKAAEAAERRAKSAPTYKLSARAKRALGRVSPELAWLKVCTMVSHVQGEYEAAGEELCRVYRLGVDLSDLLAWLENMSPVKGLNLAHNQVADLDLQDLPHQQPLELLRAMLEMAVNRRRERIQRRVFRLLQAGQPKYCFGLGSFRCLPPTRHTGGLLRRGSSMAGWG